MGLLDFFGKSEKAAAAPKFKTVQKVPWVRSPKGGFRKLVLVDTDDEKLKEGGVVVVWHGGIKPAWVYVADEASVGREVADIIKNKEILSYESRGGLYVTWVHILPEFRPGVVRYLIDHMHPVVENRSAPSGSVEPIPVYFPGKGDV